MKYTLLIATFILGLLVVTYAYPNPQTDQVLAFQNYRVLHRVQEKLTMLSLEQTVLRLAKTDPTTTLFVNTTTVNVSTTTPTSSKAAAITKKPAVAVKKPVVKTPTKKTVAVTKPASKTKTPAAVSNSKSTVGAIALKSFNLTADPMSTLPSGELYIDKPTVRATVKNNVSEHAKVTFTYLGYTKETVPLADGELRRQMAFKLLGQDLCNMIIVSWQFEPHQRLQILKKYNPGKSAFEDCGANGYTVLNPIASKPTPVVKINSTHTMEAQIDAKDILIVNIDGQEVWRGTVQKELAQIKGPVGLRTDNAVFKLKFYTL